MTSKHDMLWMIDDHFSLYFLLSTDVCIVGVARTPMGGFLGALSSLSATKLGSVAIQCKKISSWFYYSSYLPPSCGLWHVSSYVQVLLKGQMLSQHLFKKSFLGMFWVPIWGRLPPGRQPWVLVYQIRWSAPPSTKCVHPGWRVWITLW